MLEAAIHAKHALTCNIDTPLNVASARLGGGARGSLRRSWSRPCAHSPSAQQSGRLLPLAGSIVWLDTPVQPVRQLHATPGALSGTSYRILSEVGCGPDTGAGCRPHEGELSGEDCGACRVKVGGGTVRDALRMLGMQPVLWAGAAALALSYAQQPLPPTASSICVLPACCAQSRYTQASGAPLWLGLPKLPERVQGLTRAVRAAAGGGRERGPGRRPHPARAAVHRRSARCAADAGAAGER